MVKKSLYFICKLFLGWWPLDVMANNNDAILEYTLLTAPIVVGPNAITHTTNTSKNIKVYPNPATTTNTIEFATNIGDNIKIEIVDAIGKQIKLVVATKSNNKQFYIKSTIESLQEGFYYYKVTVNNNVSIIKFVKL